MGIIGFQDHQNWRRHKILRFLPPLLSERFGSTGGGKNLRNSTDDNFLLFTREACRFFACVILRVNKGFGLFSRKAQRSFFSILCISKGKLRDFCARSAPKIFEGFQG